MKETRYYEVAGHRFCVSGEEEVFTLMGNYEPFAFADGEVFALSIGSGEAPKYTEELRQKDEGQEIIWKNCDRKMKDRKSSADIRLQVKRCLNFIGGA